MSTASGKRLVGGLSNVRDVDDDARTVALSVRAEIEAQAKVVGEFEKFEPVKVATQVVAGTNFFFKIRVGDGENHYIHARVFRDLPHNDSTVSCHSVQTEKTLDEQLTHF